MITTINVNHRNSTIPSQEVHASSDFPLNEIGNDPNVENACCHEEIQASKQQVAAILEPSQRLPLELHPVESDGSSSVLLPKSVVTTRNVQDIECDDPGEIHLQTCCPALNQVLRSMLESVMLSIRTDTQYSLKSNRFLDEFDPFPIERTEASNSDNVAYTIYMDLLRLCRSTTPLNESISEIISILCNGIQAPEINAVVTGKLLSTLQSIMEYPYVAAIHRQDIYAKIMDALIYCVFEETNILPNSRHNSLATSGSSPDPVLRHATSLPSAVNSAVTPPTANRRRSSATLQQPLNLTNMSNGNGPQLSYEDGTPKNVPLGGSQRFNLAQGDDERAVFKLLQLITLIVKNIVKTESPPICIESKDLEALVAICWHVQFRSNAASILLKKAAAYSELQIFQSIFTSHKVHDHTEFCCNHLRKIANLLVPTSLSYGDDNSRLSGGSFRNDGGINYGVALQSLSLLQSLIEMICIRVIANEKTSPISQVLEQEVSRAIITLAIHTNNPVTLQTCIHVINLLLNRLGLFRLKCELEVFIHAVLVRRLDDGTDSKASSPEEKEVVLEYLHEVCNSPGMGMSTVAFSPVNMLDLYLNFDCDSDCSNVFENIVCSLGKFAQPTSCGAFDGTSNRFCDSTSDMDRLSNFRSLIKVDGTSASPPASSVSTPFANKSLSPDIVSTGPSINHLNRLALNCILATIKSIEELATHSADEVGLPQAHRGVISLNEDQVVMKRKRKLSLEKVVQSFNSTNPDKGEWLDVAVKEGIFKSTTDCRAAADFLFKAHMDIDKQRIGVYLSRGPESGFPFHAGVRSHFVSMHNFRDLSFAKALRKFLSKFRLPGEAQCIDRLMEAFSKEYFDQNSSSTFFQNSDAVYVLAFSTIMLNTDLHNPTIKADRRMTSEQFLRNNRGINAGDDLPEDFVSDLYDQIKERELQIRSDVGQFMIRNCDDSDVHWNEIRDRKLDIGEAVCLSIESRKSGCKAIAKHLFHLSKDPSFFATIGMFLKSTDNSMVVSALRGLQRLSTLATLFEFTTLSSDILHVYLLQGHEYVCKCISQEISVSIGHRSARSLNDASRHRHSNSNGSATLLDDTMLGDDFDAIPYELLSSGSGDGNSSGVLGSATHRGLLALDSGLVLLRNDPTAASDIWPLFVQCLCSLRDARALPPSLSDLDDFADCNGNILPLSSFARASQKRLDEYHRSISEKDNLKQKGWFRSLFRKSKVGDQIESTNSDTDEILKPELSIYAKALVGVAEAVDIENIVIMASSKLPDAAIGPLLEVLDAYPFENDPEGEQHAVFTLEIAARALLSNRERAENSFLLFLGKFESILCKVTNIEGEVPAAPFVIERIVVTILRCSIHLYEFPELRPHLRASLQLLTMTLPKDFVRSISDRISCGLAIILRANYPYFEPHHNQEWSLISEMFDILANYSTSRVLVFDGIASTVEHAMPNFNPNTAVSSILPTKNDASTDVMDVSAHTRPSLSIEACSALARILTRFVLGFYQGDQTLSVPAMLCLEKVYRRKVEILTLTPSMDDATDDSKSSSKIAPVNLIATVPDKELWQNVVVAVYSVCRSTDPDASTEAAQCYRRLVLRTGVDEIANDKWITILYLMMNKQPPIVSEVSRGNTFFLLGQLMLRLIPKMSHRTEHREDLEDLIIQYAALAEENITASIEDRNRNSHHHQGRKSVMFDKTMQTLTYICNHIMSDEWDGSHEFRLWMNETLMTPIEVAASSDLRFKTGKVVTTTTMDALEDDDVSEISDSVAGDEYGREERSQSDAGY